MTRAEAMRMFLNDAHIVEGDHNMPVIVSGVNGTIARKELKLERKEELVMLRNRKIVLEEVEKEIVRGLRGLL